MSERSDAMPLEEFPELLAAADGLLGDDVYVLICDLDDFGALGDDLGRQRADAVLNRVGEVFRQDFGAAHAFHYGSDEFIVVNSFFDEYSFQEKVDRTAHRIAAISAVPEPREAETAPEPGADASEPERLVSGTDSDTPLGITCSFGYVHGAIASPAALHEAIRLADQKMGEAKRLGKARVVGRALEGDAAPEDGNPWATQLKSYKVDELTGLMNLVYFHVALEDLLARVSRTGTTPGEREALVYFNIENFKGYNQHFGFSAGDDLLQLVARAIQRAFPGGVAARFSADQFMVATTEERVVPGIEEVRQAFRKEHKDSSIWLRAGYYFIDPADDDPGVVCDRAKSACDAIRGRRNIFYNEYDEALKRQIIWRRYVLDNFDRALDEGWIKVFYQPIVRVATGDVCDVEALARWIDPVEGIISPIDFIPALEDARLIHKLDLHVLRAVCEECDRLRGMGREFIPPSINLSRLDFELCDIVSEVEAVLDEFGIRRDMLSIEVTESALVGNQDFLKTEVDRFRADGFEVWMDDFGSGYSSLNVLKDYKFDLVKIDMEFLRGFEDQKESRIMLAHLVNMVKELGLQTLVEGVETEEQLHYLRSIGVGRAQGFLIGRPLPLDESILSARSGGFPPIEQFGKRDFYYDIGRVNLIRPDPQQPVEGSYLPSDVAACIIRRRNGRYEYLNTNDLYAKFLQDVGIGTTADSEAVINDVDNPRRSKFVSVLDACAKSGEWEYYTMGQGDRMLLVRMKEISEAPEYDAIAVLSIVDEVPRRWLEALEADEIAI